jgi:CHAT domain-containing protein
MLKRTARWKLGLAALIVLVFAGWFVPDWLGRLALERGLRAQREWRLDEAVKYFSWARRLQRSDDAATLQLGLCQQLRGDFLSSQKELNALLQKKVEDKETLSRIHNAIGVNQYSFAEPDASIASHQLALELARSVGNRRLEATALIDLSRAFYHSKGKFTEAIANLEQARSIAREIADERTEAAAIRNLGVVYWWFKGELDRPLKEFYFPALELYRRQNDQRGMATMLTLIALVFNNKGDIYNFMQYQNQGIEIQERIGDQAGLSDSYMTLGILYNGIGNYRKAREWFGQGLAITERTGYRLAQNDLHALLADVHVNLDEYDEALKLYDPQLKHKTKDSVLSNYELQYIAHCYQLKSDYVQAISLYERALRVHEQAGLPDVRFRSNTLLRIAECAIALGDWPRASQVWALAKEDFEKAETHSGGLIRPAIVRAAIARHEGRHQEALKYLQHALDVEAQIFASARTNFLIPPHRRSYELLYSFLLDYKEAAEVANKLAFGFLENMRYRSLRNFLIRVREKRVDVAVTKEKERALAARIEKLSNNLKSNDNEAAREQLRKAYAEFEELTLKAQLEQPQYLAIAAAKPVELAKLQQNLTADTALVEFLFVGDRVFALVITQQGLRTIELPASRGALAAKTKLFRSLIFRIEADETVWRPVAESLRATVIEPLEKAGTLKGVSRIGLVPYAFLHNLPFAALTRSENDRVRFLVEDYTLFQTPSATFYAHKAEQQISDHQPKLTIAFGRNGSNEPGLPRLEFAAEEATTVAQTTGGVALTNQKATESELKHLSNSCNYLHLSTHAVAESEMPLFSRLLLEPSNTDDGNLTVREIFELGLRTKLVTLSACETGQSYSASGTDFIEQDRIGLIEAFLHAGSNSVLATLLPISDQPTTAFMEHFYGELTRHDNMADALTLTQRAMLRGQITLPVPAGNASKMPITHPRYWSPFILVGSSL